MCFARLEIEKQIHWRYQIKGDVSYSLDRPEVIKRLFISPPPSLLFRVHLIVCLIKSHFSNRNEDDNKTKAKTIANSLWPNKIKRKHVNKNKKVFFLNEERTSIAPRNEHFPPFNADQNKNKNIKKWKREFGIKRQWTLLKKRLKNKNKSVENKSTCQTQLSLLC